jgi:hypothetical protein
MSNFEDEYDDEFDEQEQQQSNGPKALREALKKAHEENRKLAAELSKLSEAQAETSLQSILNAKGVSPKIVRFLKADKVEANEDAVTKWLDENAEVFNIKVNETAPEGESSETEDEQEVESQDDGKDPYAGLPEDVANALKGIANGQQMEAQNSAGDVDDEGMSKKLEAIGSNAKSFNDAVKALGALGARVGNGG